MTVSSFSPFSRRELILKGGKLSAVGMAMVAGIGSARAADPLQATMPAAVPGAATAATPVAGKDVDILNTALSLEHQAIAAYQICADSGFMQNLALNIVLLFQGHHKAHRDALIAAVQKLGGTPVVTQSAAEYGAQLGMSLAKTQNAALQLMLKLELTATNNYAGFAGSIADRDCTRLAARIAADDAMHWTALASTLGQPLPANGLTFGV